MPDHIPLPAKQYSVIYADPPWAYSQGGNTKSSHGIAKQHYQTMTTAEICALPVREIVREGAACFMWATFPNITEAIKVMEAWGFTYKTAAFVWVKKNRKQGGNFMGLGAYTRANAEVCLLGVTPGFKAKTQIRAHNVHQIIEAPFEGHSKKPDETRRRIVELLGDVPRLEMFARQRADGWDALGPAPISEREEETVAILGLLHDVCKAGVYHIERKRRRNPETGVWEDYLGYTFRDPLPLGHGEKSLYQIARFIRLEDHEALAIRWHMGAYDTAARTDLRDLSAAMDATPWVWRLHEADMCAAHIDERGADE